MVIPLGSAHLIVFFTACHIFFADVVKHVLYADIWVGS